MSSIAALIFCFVIYGLLRIEFNKITRKSKPKKSSTPKPIATTKPVTNNQYSPTITIEFDQPEIDEPIEVVNVRSSLEFDYQNMDGVKSHRTVDVINMELQGARKRLWGYCHKRDDFRTFNIDRIKNCVDVNTGEIIDDVAGFLMELHQQQLEVYKASVEYSCNEFGKKHKDTLGVLYYVAKSDGQFRAAEKLVISELLKSLIGDERVTPDIVKKLYEFRQVPTKDEFEIMVDNVSLMSEKQRSVIMQAAIDIVATQKHITLQEQQALDYMKQKFQID